jgi:drug/metabolite transporter (DMT)-like permease
LKFVPEFELTLPVVLVVLAAALLHAGWNALIRGATDKGLYTLLLHACSGFLALLAIGFVGLPATASYPFIIASALIHTVYIAWLMRAYVGGQLALSYTLMRGLPPLMVAMISGPLLGEFLGLNGWLGITCICSGVLMIGLAAGRTIKQVLEHPSSRAALLNASAIAAYTVIDGQGARLSGNAVSYAICLFALEPLIILGVNFRRRGPQMRDYFAQHWRLGLLGALCSTGAYTAILWAMTQAPIAMVAALRESSVIFAVLIGSLWFGEGRLRLGLVAGCLVVAGILLLRL